MVELRPVAATVDTTRGVVTSVVSSTIADPWKKRSREISRDLAGSTVGA